MKLNKDELQQLNKNDLLRVLWYARYKTALHKIRKLHPAQIVVPTVILQIIIFVVFVFHSLYAVAVGNLVVVSIALLPFALYRPKPRYHWVRGE